MSETIGRGVIEIVADARKLKAGIEDAKRSVRTLGEGQKDITKSAQQSIDRYIGKLQLQNAVLGKTTRETELYKLALRGASNEQLKSADAALRLSESHAKAERAAASLKAGFVSFATIAATALAATVGVIDHLIKQAGDFQDMAEKVGDSAAAIASLAVAAKVGGTSMDQLVNASVKLTKNLTGVDDESKAAGAAIAALGLDIDQFKKLSPVDRIEAIAKALGGFAEGSGKTAVAVALLGKSGADLLPFLKELAGQTGRQNILTAEQIRLADEYSDSQKRLLAEINLHAQSLAIQAQPIFDFLLRDLDRIITKFGDASRAGLGFFETLASEAVIKATLPFGLVGDKIKALQGQLDSLKAGPQVEGFFGSSSKSIENLEKTIKYLKADQVSRALASTKGIDYDEARFKRREPTKVLKFDGAIKDVKGERDKAAEEARRAAAERLAFDLAQIKRASDATISTLANSERIVGAMRSAGLVADKAYYDAKLGFIQLNSREQEAALQQEIKRLKEETFTGEKAVKDQLENKRKIADADAKIKKIREDAATQTKVNSIEQEAALARIAQAYVDATKSAEAYIDTIKRQDKREIEGIGKGDKFRANQQGLGSIDDRRVEDIRRLQNEFDRGQLDKGQFDAYLKLANATYAKEIEAYKNRTNQLLALEGDWVVGATDALQNYYDESQNIAKNTGDAFGNAFKSAEDALVEFTATGKLNFKSFADSILRELLRISVKQYITGPLAGLLKGSIEQQGNSPASSGGQASSGLGGLGGLVSSFFSKGKTETTTQLAAPVSDGIASSAEATTVALKGMADSSNVTTFALKEFAGDGVERATTQLFEQVTTGAIEQTATQTVTGSLISLSFAADLATAAMTKQATTGAVASFAGYTGGHAVGGQVIGPGTGTSDSILTKVSNQEYIVRAIHAKQPDTLKFLNTVNKRGLLPALAERDEKLNDAIPGHAHGGQVIGAGTNTSDSIIRKVSNQEFIVRAVYAKQPETLKFLNTVNKRGLNAALTERAGPVKASYASGINFVPQTGNYLLHKGEAVTPAARAGDSMVSNIVVNQSFAAGTDTRTVNQAASVAGRAVQRAIRRNG